MISFYCKYCDYYSNIDWNFKEHLKTTKHLNNITNKNTELNLNPLDF